MVLPGGQLHVCTEILKAEKGNGQLVIPGQQIGDGELALNIRCHRNSRGLQLNLRALQYGACGIGDPSGDDALG